MGPSFIVKACTRLIYCKKKKERETTKRRIQRAICTSQQAMESQFCMRFCRNPSGRSQVPQVWRNHVQSISQCSNTSLRYSQFNQDPPTEYVMSQPPQIIKDKTELKATFNCLLNHGFPFKDVDFGNILESGMLHMGKYTANESQQRASHMHTKSEIRRATVVLFP